MTSFASAIKSIRSLTLNNDHTEARIEGCVLLGPAADGIKAQLLRIQADQQRRHELSVLAEHQRNELDEQLQALAKVQLGDDYETFRRAF